MKNELRLGAICLLAFLAGCSSMNPWSEAKDKPKPLELAPISQSASSLKARCHVSVGKSEPFVLTHGVDRSSVSAADADGDLSRFDNGKQVCKISVSQTISGGVVSDGKIVVVGTPKG